MHLILTMSLIQNIRLFNIELITRNIFFQKGRPATSPITTGHGSRGWSISSSACKDNCGGRRKNRIKVNERALSPRRQRWYPCLRLHCSFATCKHWTASHPKITRLLSSQFQSSCSMPFLLQRHLSRGHFMWQTVHYPFTKSFIISEKLKNNWAIWEYYA